MCQGSRNEQGGFMLLVFLSLFPVFDHAKSTLLDKLEPGCVQFCRAHSLDTQDNEIG